ncbi:MAG: Transcriptional regulator GlxA family, contains an amidase domain and an AraC-type DNA-binding [Pseudomonas sp.]|nr:Transcriptional regulator GlxA family, contains an amidase domain and an AraC-type DNA-binding [Pseudomonas sp.]
MTSIQAFKARHIVFLALSPIIELDLLGPMNVFAIAGSAYGAAPAPAGEQLYRMTIATANDDLAIQGECGANITAHKHYLAVTEPIDTLMIVGGGAALGFEGDPEICAWLRDTSTRARRTGSICTGAFVLAAAGLLDGRRAATHWSVTHQLAKRYPNIAVDSESIWIKDGPFYTSAGITAGIDLALALVEEDHGSRVSLEVARQLVVFLKRPGGQRQFSRTLKAQMPTNRSFADLVAWISDNLDKPLSVENLAERVAMSPRNFARVFREELGTTPANYVRQNRILTARNLLEETDRSLGEIANNCGYGSDELMRQAFIKELNVTPGQYRRTFATSGIG